MMLSDDLELPPLRQELRLEPASANSEGIPRWRLYDPLQHRFYLISQEDVALLSRWSAGTLGALRTTMSAKKQRLDDELFEGLLRFLNTHHLLQLTNRQAYDRLAEKRASLRGQGITGLLNRLLAFRLPLWNPHRLLHILMPVIALLGQRTLILIWTLLTGLGLYLTTRQWDEFIGTFSDFFSPAGLAAYGCALIGLKILHELGHAYVATVQGCRVGSMGITVFMGMPMLYTDMGDVSRLDNYHQRMWIAAGGVMAETFVAGLATLAWAVFPDGTVRSVAFVLATSSWLTSLLINLNPLSRFDGYYFLSDALRIDNLQPRAFAYNQWLLGRLLFGSIEDVPEPLTRQRAAFFVLYGTFSWCYQMALSCGIAYFAYQTLFKSLGVMILLYTVWYYVIRRLLHVIEHWWQLRDQIRLQRWVVLGGLGGALLVLLCLPLDRQVSVPVMLGWQHETPIQAPENARIEAILVKPGVFVSKGQLLFRFYSPELESKQAKARLNLAIANERLNRIGGDAQDRTETIVLSQQQQQAQAELEGLSERARLLEWHAPEAGVFVDMPATLQAGQWVRPDQNLGRLLHGEHLDANGYVAAKDLLRLSPGNTGVFIADEPALPRFNVTLNAIETTASEFILPDSLSSHHGGPIPTQPNDQGKSVPVTAQHRANFAVEGTEVLASPLKMRGTIFLNAAPVSLVEQIIDRLWHLLITEWRT